MGGVATWKFPYIGLLSFISLVLILGSPAAATAAACEKTSSPMFGALWADNFVLYTQDYNWKMSGDISKVNLYYGESEGCVKGIKAQYGADPANAQRLGVETKTLLLRSMQLRAGERIIRAEYKAPGKCIEYLSLRTNQGRQLAVGKHDSPTPLAVSAPANPNGYLGYLNGHTAKPMSNPHVGKLMQLQLVWASSSCDGSKSSSSAVATAAAGGKRKGGKKIGSGAVKASIAGMISSSSSDGDSDMQEEAAGPKCVGNQLCKDGKCATSSCLLAGIGSEVPNLMCLGTNMRLPFLSSGMDVSPCSFLGCKLDAASCTSSGLIGVGGFCTGKVVAVGAASMLHPQGKQWLGYPCVEHKSSSLGLRAGMLGEMTGAEDMVMKSWKVCDCVKKVPTRNSLAILMPNGTITSFIFGKGAYGQQQQPTVAVPLMPVYDMTIKDVVTQWLAAKAGNAGLPTATISPQLATDLKQLLPGFMTPSILIANTSAALMMYPDWMTEVPVFVLPNSALGAFKSFLPDLTALPTLAVDDGTTAAEAAAMLELPSDLLISDITIDALPALASKLGLPTFLKLNPSTATNKVDSKTDVGPHLVPLDVMHIGNMIVQWATAASRQAPLPILTLNSKADLAKLQQKVPGLVTPSIIVPNISQALLFKPSQLVLPLFVLPAELSSEVMVMLPEITSLPSFLVLASDNKQDLPKLQLTDLIAPNMRVLVDTLGPSIPMLLKQMTALNGGPASNMTSSDSEMTSMVDGPWGHLLSSALPQIPGMLVDTPSVEMGTISEVLGAVKAALETSGFKLPYLTMTEDTLQKWGVKKIESFVTSVVTRAVSPREDPSLIDDSDDDQATEEYRPKSRTRSKHQNRKSHPAGDTNDQDAMQTASRHTKVAAALSSMQEGEQDVDGDAQAMGEPEALFSAPKQQQQQQQQQKTDQPSEDHIDEVDHATSKQHLKKKQTHTKNSQQQQSTGASASAAPAAAPKDADTSVADSSSTSSSSSKQPSSVSSEEPAQKAAYSPPPTTPAASTGAATATSAAPAATVPTTPASDSSRGIPVPTQPMNRRSSVKPTAPAAAKVPTPSQAAAEAEKRRAAAAAENQVQLDREAKEALGKAQAAAAAAAAAAAEAAKQPAPAPGTVDEDGAVVVDMAEAKRAFMSTEQWAEVPQEHKVKLLKLLDVEA